MTPSTTGLMQLPSVVSKDEEGEKLIERGRIKTPADLCSIHQTFFNADLLASQKRSVIQAMVDGAAPYSQERDRLTGQAGRANINWLQLSDAMDEAVKPYVTLLESLDVFCSTPTTHGDANSRMNWEPIMAEEITRTIKLWPSFFPNWQRNARLFKMDGVSFAFFEDNIDWRWKIQGMMDVKTPREVPADVEQFDMITCEAVMYPHELFRKIQAEKHLPEDERYWNVNVAIAALKQAAPLGLDMSNWEAVERAWKDNDLTYGMTSAVIKVIHGWAKELDGTVTHLIARYDGAPDFLYKCEGKYGRMSQLLTIYTDGVGTNGDLHSIRGMGYKMFGVAAGQNKLFNKALDGACIAATPHLSSESEDAITDRAIQPMGPYMVLDNKFQYAEQPTVNLAQNIMPVLARMDSLFSSKASASAPVMSAGLNRTEKTKYQVQSEEEQTGALMTGSFFIFMSSWGMHLRNVVRRLTNREYQSTDPGGTEVMELRHRLVSRGVPLDAFFAIDINAMEINMGIGKGSVQERRSSLSAVYQLLVPSMDQKGRQIMNRATATSYLGTNMGRELFPDTEGLRPPMDAQVAQLENSVMSLGQPSAFEVNQDHVVHMEAHIAFLTQVMTVFEEEPLPEKLRETVDKMQPVWEHCINDHLPLINDQDPDYARFKEALQQMGEFITNSRKHLDAEDARAARDQAEGEMLEDPGQVPGGLLRSAAGSLARAEESEQLVIAQTRQEIADKKAEAFRKSQLFAQELAAKRQDMAIKDVDTALKVKQANQKPNGKRPPRN